MIVWWCFTHDPVMCKPPMQVPIDYRYNRHILTGMRKLLVTLDDPLDKALAGVPNQSRVVREALNLYMRDISTPDTIEGLRESYTSLLRFMETRFAVYDESFRRMDKLIEYLESRMQ